MIIAKQELRPSYPFPELNNKNLQIVKVITQNLELFIISAYINPEGKEKFNQLKELFKILEFLYQRYPTLPLILYSDLNHDLRKEI